ncbi:hypothetical protein Ddye_015965 [Dipteronia dyeriana]|uniref:Photolyase/cryptochrome alpha/beta domain-containing protein n=1 Tax=Dipteronia dyeriana TaxID=168575 RepID=A0AAD9U5U3_9ROSI|nr:hypothetical protein Ddye_015965 [Dipteronia dyeriana]
MVVRYYDVPVCWCDACSTMLADRICTLNELRTGVEEKEYQVDILVPRHHVPELNVVKTGRIVSQCFERYYTSTTVKRNGKGTAIVWFRNDLRILDSEALFKARFSSDMILPVYYVDARLFQSTYHFGFPKIGALRGRFLIECLADLRKNLMKRGLNLMIQHGKPEEIIPSFAESFGAHTVE